MNQVIPAWQPDGLHGEIVSDVTLTAADIARFNEARESFKLIKALYWAHVVPSLGGFDNPVAGE
ncbi:hypothetical protein HP547_03030, partial [Pseudomonas sp. CrR7]|nr:hypothetical protein [Pseudomonas sp. CM27]